MTEHAKEKNIYIHLNFHADMGLTLIFYSLRKTIAIDNR